MKIKGWDWLKNEVAAPGAALGVWASLALQFLFCRPLRLAGFAEMWLLGVMVAFFLGACVVLADEYLLRNYRAAGWGKVSPAYVSMFSPTIRFLFWVWIYSWGMAFLCATALWELISFGVKLRRYRREKNNLAIGELIDAIACLNTDRRA